MHLAVEGAKPVQGTWKLIGTWRTLLTIERDYASLLWPTFLFYVWQSAYKTPTHKIISQTSTYQSQTLMQCISLMEVKYPLKKLFHLWKSKNPLIQWSAKAEKEELWELQTHHLIHSPSEMPVSLLHRIWHVVHKQQRQQRVQATHPLLNGPSFLLAQHVPEPDIWEKP